MEYSKSICRFIEYQLMPFEMKLSKSYPNSIFWFKDGRAIVEIEKSKYFMLHHQIWKTISKMFSLDYYETQQVIKVWLEEQDKLGVLTPYWSYHYKFDELEEQDKLGALTPGTLGSVKGSKVEEQYKLGELIPKITDYEKTQSWKNKKF